jgi:predicted outer membrane repeat protein
MRALLMVSLCVVFSTGAQGSTWHVDGSGGGDFLTIQSAIVSATSGDEIVVSPGTYTENIDYVGKNVRIFSSGGALVTRIDGGGVTSCVTFRSGESSSATLEGFTLTHGAGQLYESVILGGAVFCLQSSPSIRGCVFTENASTYAAGIYVDYANPEIADCSFTHNTAQTYGGAIAGPDAIPWIHGCLFEYNYAGTGDGTIHLALNSVIENCIFRYNEARAGAAINSGGFGADFVIRDCIFIGNRAHGIHGGAIRVHEAAPSISRCLFIENYAQEDGGAIVAIDGATPTIESCTFDRNTCVRYGGTIASWDGSYLTFSNNIVVGTVHGGGVFCSGASGEFSCNDVWGNGGGNYTGDCPDPIGTQHNISVDPLFCDRVGGNYTLESLSPCAPPNQPVCGLIGVYGVGCTPPTPTQNLTWGGLKGLYR